jgi:hypothetical protein
VGQSELKQLGGEAQQFVGTITSLKLIAGVVFGCFVVSGNGHGFFMEPMGDVNELFFCSALVVLRKELLIHG